MPPSKMLWKFVMVAVALPLLDCTAKKSSSASLSWRARSGEAQPRSSPQPDTRRRSRTTYDEERDEEEEDSFGEWSGSESASDGEGAWDSYDGSEESEYVYDDRQNSRGSHTRATPPPPRSSPSFDLDYDSYEGDDLDATESSEESLWSNEGELSGDGEASWDTGASAGKQRRSDVRRPRPSAWTGDDANSGGRKRPSGRGVPPRRGAAQGSVVRYQQRGRSAPTRGFGVKIPAVSGTAIAAAMRRQMGTAREAVGQAGTLAASTSKMLKREVKLAVSGSWESALLKVTWPDDLPPDEELVYSLVDAVKAFKLDKDVTKNSAEHRVLLRKLWTKMSEPDWRTVSKAVYLFHTILKDLSLEHHAVLKIFLGKMSREWDKRTGGRYFDLDVLCGVNEEGAPFRSFVDRYGTYVFRRADAFNARFQELDGMHSEDGWEHVITTLAKAQNAIELGLSCRPEPEEETELTVLCLRSTADDVRQLWQRFHSALAWVLDEAENGDLFEGVDKAVVTECLDSVKDFYTSRYDEVATFLDDAEELLGIYDLHVPDLGLPSAHDFDAVSYSSPPPSSDTSNTGEGEEEEDGDSDDLDYDESYEDDSDDGSVTATRTPVPSAKIADRRAAAHRASKASSRGAVGTSGGSGSSDSSGSVADASSKVGATNSATTSVGASRSATTPERGGVGGTCEVVAGEIEGRTTGGVDAIRPGVEAVEGDSDNDDDDDVDEDGSESEGVEGSQRSDDEEEDSAEEGAVDDHVDDLTYFDDATQPEGTDGDWERY